VQAGGRCDDPPVQIQPLAAREVEAVAARIRHLRSEDQHASGHEDAGVAVPQYRTSTRSSGWQCNCLLTGEVVERIGT
jgi:hypothetical protein